MEQGCKGSATPPKRDGKATKCAVGWLDISLGARCREFESPHSDHLSQKNRLFRRFFCVFSSAFSILTIAILRWFKGQKSGGSMSKNSSRKRQIPNLSLTVEAMVYCRSATLEIEFVRGVCYNYINIFLSFSSAI